MDWDDEEGDRYSHNSGSSWRIKCGELERMAEHQDVVIGCYNTAGALIGTHFRCKVCNSVWNQYATKADFPDPHGSHSK